MLDRLLYLSSLGHPLSDGQGQLDSAVRGDLGRCR